MKSINDISKHKRNETPNKSKMKSRVEKKITVPKKQKKMISLSRSELYHCLKKLMNLNTERKRKNALHLSKEFQSLKIDYSIEKKKKTRSATPDSFMNHSADFKQEIDRNTPTLYKITNQYNNYMSYKDLNSPKQETKPDSNKLHSIPQHVKRNPDFTKTPKEMRENHEDFTSSSKKEREKQELPQYDNFMWGKTAHPVLRTPSSSATTEETTAKKPSASFFAKPELLSPQGFAQALFPFPLQQSPSQQEQNSKHKQKKTLGLEEYISKTPSAHAQGRRTGETTPLNKQKSVAKTIIKIPNQINYQISKHKPSHTNLMKNYAFNTHNKKYKHKNKDPHFGGRNSQLSQDLYSTTSNLSNKHIDKYCPSLPSQNKKYSILPFKQSGILTHNHKIDSKNFNPKGRPPRTPFSLSLAQKSQPPRKNIDRIPQKRMTSEYTNTITGKEKILRKSASMQDFEEFSLNHLIPKAKNLVNLNPNRKNPKEYNLTIQTLPFSNYSNKIKKKAGEGNLSTKYFSEGEIGTNSEERKKDSNYFEIQRFRYLENEAARKIQAAFRAHKEALKQKKLIKAYMKQQSTNRANIHSRKKRRKCKTERTHVSKSPSPVSSGRPTLSSRITPIQERHTHHSSPRHRHHKKRIKTTKSNQKYKFQPFAASHKKSPRFVNLNEGVFPLSYQERDNLNNRIHSQTKIQDKLSMTPNSASRGSSPWRTKTVNKKKEKEKEKEKEKKRKRKKAKKIKDKVEEKKRKRKKVIKDSINQLENFVFQVKSSLHHSSQGKHSLNLKSIPNKLLHFLSKGKFVKKRNLSEDLSSPQNITFQTLDNKIEKSLRVSQHTPKIEVTNPEGKQFPNSDPLRGAEPLFPSETPPPIPDPKFMNQDLEDVVTSNSNSELISTSNVNPTPRNLYQLESSVSKCGVSKEGEDESSDEESDVHKMDALSDWQPLQKRGERDLLQLGKVAEKEKDLNEKEEVSIFEEKKEEKEKEERKEEIISEERNKEMNSSQKLANKSTRISEIKEMLKHRNYAPNVLSENEITTIALKKTIQFCSQFKTTQFYRNREMLQTFYHNSKANSDLTLNSYQNEDYYKFLKDSVSLTQNFHSQKLKWEFKIDNFYPTELNKNFLVSHLTATKDSNKTLAFQSLNFEIVPEIMKPRNLDINSFWTFLIPQINSWMESLQRLIFSFQILKDSQFYQKSKIGRDFLGIFQKSPLLEIFLKFFLLFEEFFVRSDLSEELIELKEMHDLIFDKETKAFLQHYFIILNPNIPNDCFYGILNIFGILQNKEKVTQKRELQNILEKISEFAGLNIQAIQNNWGTIKRQLTKHFQILEKEKKSQTREKKQSSLFKSLNLAKLINRKNLKTPSDGVNLLDTFAKDLVYDNLRDILQMYKIKRLFNGHKIILDIQNEKENNQFRSLATISRNVCVNLEEVNVNLYDLNVSYESESQEFEFHESKYQESKYSEENTNTVKSMHLVSELLKSKRMHEKWKEGELTHFKLASNKPVPIETIQIKDRGYLSSDSDFSELKNILDLESELKMRQKSLSLYSSLKKKRSEGVPQKKKSSQNTLPRTKSNQREVHTLFNLLKAGRKTKINSLRDQKTLLRKNPKFLIRLRNQYLIVNFNYYSSFIETFYTKVSLNIKTPSF